MAPETTQRVLDELNEAIDGSVALDPITRLLRDSHVGHHMRKVAQQELADCEEVRAAGLKVAEREQMNSKVVWAETTFFMDDDLGPSGQILLSEVFQPFEDVVSAVAMAHPWLQQARPLAQVKKIVGGSGMRLLRSASTM